MNDNGQMLVLESIIFAISVVISISFMFTLSPISIEDSTGSVTDLKEIGDAALNTIYSEQVSLLLTPYDGGYTNNPTSKLAVCIIFNRYDDIGLSLDELLPDNVLYNFYIADPFGTKLWWRSSIGNNPANEVLPNIGTVFTSRRVISIDPIHLIDYPDPLYNTGGGETQSDIANTFLGDPPVEPFDYAGSIYEVILELWNI